MDFKQTFDRVGCNIAERFVAEMELRVPKSFFDIVLDYPGDWNGIHETNRIGLLRLAGERPFFAQERFYDFTLRLGVVDTIIDPWRLNDFVEEVRRHIEDIGFIPGVYSGLNVVSTSYDFPEAQGFRFAELAMEILWVHDRPLVFDGAELQQTILTESVEDASLSESGGLTLTPANLQDRDPATVGLSGTVPAPPSGAFLEITFPSAIRVDYILLGNFSTTEESQVSFEYDPGSGFVSWLEAPGKLYEAGEHYFKLREVEGTGFRVKFKSAGAGTHDISLAYVFIGLRYDFVKSYDVRASSIDIAPVVQVTTGLDDPKGIKIVTQGAGDRKDTWDVAFGLRKVWFDGLIEALLVAGIDQKAFLFRDSYRDELFHLVKSDDPEIRGAQFLQDYIRVNLRMTEQ